MGTLLAWLIFSVVVGSVRCISPEKAEELLTLKMYQIDDDMSNAIETYDSRLLKRALQDYDSLTTGSYAFKGNRVVLYRRTAYRYCDVSATNWDIFAEKFNEDSRANTYAYIAYHRCDEDDEDSSLPMENMALWEFVRKFPVRLLSNIANDRGLLYKDASTFFSFVINRTSDYFSPRQRNWWEISFLTRYDPYIFIGIAIILALLGKYGLLNSMLLYIHPSLGILTTTTSILSNIPKCLETVVYNLPTIAAIAVAGGVTGYIPYSITQGVILLLVSNYIIRMSNNIVKISEENYTLTLLNIAILAGGYYLWTMPRTTSWNFASYSVGDLPSITTNKTFEDWSLLPFFIGRVSAILGLFIPVVFLTKGLFDYKKGTIEACNAKTKGDTSALKDWFREEPSYIMTILRQPATWALLSSYAVKVYTSGGLVMNWLMIDFIAMIALATVYTGVFKPAIVQNAMAAGQSTNTFMANSDRTFASTMRIIEDSTEKDKLTMQIITSVISLICFGCAWNAKAVAFISVGFATYSYINHSRRDSTLIMLTAIAMGLSTIDQFSLSAASTGALVFVLCMAQSNHSWGVKWVLEAFEYPSVEPVKVVKQ